MRVGDGECVMDASVQGLPCECTRRIRDLGNPDCERARLHGQGDPEVVEDQPDGSAQGVMVVALQLELTPHLGELPL